jgi:hypothetical protein
MVSIADAESAIRTGTMFVAAVWVYFKFARGRVFRPRLELTISGSPTRHLECHHVVVRYTVKNIGLKCLNIAHAGSKVSVEVAHAVQPTTMVSPDWQMQGYYPILKDHRWIESGEAIAEEIMIFLPDAKAVALRLVLRLEATKFIRLGGTKTVWYAQSAAPLPCEASSIPGEDSKASPAKPRVPSIEQPRSHTARAATDAAEDVIIDSA